MCSAQDPLVCSSTRQCWLQLWVSCTIVRCCCDCTASSALTTIITRLDSTGTMFVDCALCIYLFIIFDELRALFKMADGWCLFFGGRSHDLLNLQHSSRTIYAVVCCTCCSLSSDHWVCRSFVCYSNEHISCSRPLFFVANAKRFCCRETDWRYFCDASSVWTL